MPTPDLTSKSKLLCFDVESNGLHGEGFAVGAVLVGMDGKLVDEFSGRAPVKGKVDEWVAENVLPAIAEMPQTHKTTKALRQDFWLWYKQAKDQADFTVVANAYPVEARWLIACQEDDINENYWGHPFPLLDLSSLLLQVGEKPLVDRSKIAADWIGDETPKRHHPRWDAWVSALAAVEAIRRSGQLKS